jgi:hypothetical protein
MLKDKFTSRLPLKLREKVKFKTFNTFDDLIKTITKYDVAMQEIEDEKRQIDSVAHIAEYGRSNERKADPEVSEAIKELKEQTKELVYELKENKRTFNAHPKEPEDKRSETQPKPSDRRNGQPESSQYF